MLAGIAVAALLVMILFPATDVGRALHRWLVVEPAAWLARIERKQIIFFLMLMVLMLVIREAVIMAPAVDFGMVAMWDASVYLDVLAAAWMVAATARGKTGWAFVRGRASKLVARLIGHTRPAQRPRASRSAPRPPAANDSDDASDHWRFAA